MTQDKEIPNQRRQPSAALRKFLDPLDPGTYFDCGRARLHGIDDVLLREAQRRGRAPGNDTFQLIATDIGLIFCRPSISFAIAARWSEVTVSRPVGEDSVVLHIVWPIHGDLAFTVGKRLGQNVFRRWMQLQIHAARAQQATSTSETTSKDLKAENPKAKKPNEMSGAKILPPADRSPASNRARQANEPVTVQIPAVRSSRPPTPKTVVWNEGRPVDLIEQFRLSDPNLEAERLNLASSTDSKAEGSVDRTVLGLFDISEKTDAPRTIPRAEKVGHDERAQHQKSRASKIRAKKEELLAKASAKPKRDDSNGPNVTNLDAASSELEGSGTDSTDLHKSHHPGDETAAETTASEETDIDRSDNTDTKVSLLELLSADQEIIALGPKKALEAGAKPEVEAADLAEITVTPEKVLAESEDELDQPNRNIFEVARELKRESEADDLLPPESVGVVPIRTFTAEPTSRFVERPIAVAMAALILGTIVTFVVASRFGPANNAADAVGQQSEGTIDNLRFKDGFDKPEDEEQVNVGPSESPPAPPTVNRFLPSSTEVEATTSTTESTSSTEVEETSSTTGTTSTTRPQPPDSAEVQTDPLLCNSNYSGCVPDVSDVDCAGDGDGPAFLGEPVIVLGTDVYLLDTDDDRSACEPDQPKSSGRLGTS